MDIKRNSFEELVISKCSDIINFDSGISKEQLEKLVLVYERGFTDGLKVLAEGNSVKIEFSD